MNRKQALLAIVAGALLLSGCTGLTDALSLLDRPTVQSVRPTISAIDLQGVGLGFDVDIANPYPFALQSPDFRYGLDIKGAEFIQGLHDVPVNIPAGGVGTLSLPVRLDYAKLIDTYQGLKDAKEVDYKLHGALLLSGMGKSYEVPLSHSGTFPVLHTPKFSNIKVDYSDVSMTGAEVALQATVENPNAFVLGLADMGYALKLGEVEVGNLTASTLGDIASGGSGELKLNGKISAMGALMNLLRGGTPGLPTLAPTGTIQTPYGPVNLQAK